MNSFIIFSISISLGLFFLIIVQKYFLSNNIIDEIKERSSHKVIATRSGGLSIFLVVFIVSCLLYFLGYELYDFSYLVPIGLLMLVGLYDDIYRIDFKLKFIFQIIAAKIIIDNGLIIDNLHGILGVFELSRIVAQMLTIFFIVAIINSINFIDGIDGLAISIVSLFIILFEFFSSSETKFSYLSLIIIASVIPLFYFNFKKQKKIFLGDSGSLFLGCLVSIYVIYILSQDYIIKNVYDIHKIIFVISILFYPIVDITRIVFKRVIEGKSPFIADRNHLHHILLSKTKNHLISTIIILVVSLIFLTISQILLN